MMHCHACGVYHSVPENCRFVARCTDCHAVLDPIDTDFDTETGFSPIYGKHICQDSEA